MPILFSIIVPVNKLNQRYFQEQISAFSKQTLTDFEVIYIGQFIKKIKLNVSFSVVFINSKLKNPAAKRDLACKKASGKFFAFLDDDAYPSYNWLKNANKLFKDKKIAAVCGPGITSPNDHWRQQISGLFLQNPFSAGNYYFRCQKAKSKLVDDFPTFNLIMRKKVFNKLGGFRTPFWPGEDTKLCHDIVYKLKKKILYHPNILVYHHRRPILKDHLNQLGRYGIHRGYFSKILPNTSCRPSYYSPALFSLWLIIIYPLFLLFEKKLPPAIIFINNVFLIGYSLLLLSTFFYAFYKQKSLLLSLLLLPITFLSHLYYGIWFIKGLLIKNLKS